MIVYFNHWFSSIGGIIEDLKKRREDICIIGSSHNENHVMKNYVDEFYVEDWQEKNERYIDWLMPFLRQNRPDVFFLKKHTEEVCAWKPEIKQLGIHVIAENGWLYTLLDDKAGTYKMLEGVVPLPDYLRTGDAKEVWDYLQNTPDVCFKLNNGEGGESFKHVIKGIRSLMDMTNGIHNEVGYKEARQIVLNATSEERKKFIFMEYLSSPEISADCYDSNQGFICICRDKVSGTRVERLYCSKDISDACERICKTLKIQYPFNVQFRLKKGEDQKNFDNYRLLEINPRISGGLYYQTKIGLNICEVCIADVMGRDWYDINDYKLKEERFLTHIEKPIVIK